MERVDLRQKSEGEWEKLWPPMSLAEAVAALRIRLSNLRRVPGKKIRRGIGFDKGRKHQPVDEERASTSIR
jgi:hypothetical protein